MGTPSSTQTILRLLTRDPHTRRSSDQAVDDQVALYRSTCTACKGDKQACMNGTGHPGFYRLHGCAAYDLEGKVATLKAAPAPSQPWEARPARKAA